MRPFNWVGVSETDGIIHIGYINDEIEGGMGLEQKKQKSVFGNSDNCCDCYSGANAGERSIANGYISVY